MTKLRDRQRFIAENMLREHWELMLTCWDHNFEHMKKLYRLVSENDHPALRALVTSLMAAMKGWMGLWRGYVLNRAGARVRKHHPPPA